jgi:hypothetical protein
MENSEKNKEIIGQIFDTINYSSNDDLNLLLDNLNSEQLKFFTNLALTKAYDRGAFSLIESEIISKILRTNF